MAAKTGNANFLIIISGAMTDSIEILKANLGFTSRPAQKKSPGYCDNDRQPEMAKWPHTPEIQEM